MLPTVSSLVDEVAVARAELAGLVAHLSDDEGAVTPSPEEWTVSQVVEHLVWAELGGLNSMMVALDSWRRGDPVWKEANPARDEDIETIVRNTWRTKEKAPESAEPKWGGPLAYWVSVHRSCQRVVEDVAGRIREDELDDVVFPHFLSGPLTLRQRLGFLRYHMQHHAPQIKGLRRHLGR